MPASRCGVIWRRPGWRGSDSVRSSASTAGRPSISRIRFPSAAVIVSGSPSAWQPCVIPRLGCSTLRQHQRDRRIGVRRILPEHATARLAARRARAGDQQAGRGVRDPGDEIGGVELCRIDQHGHRGAFDVAAQRLAHALPELRARDARVGRARPAETAASAAAARRPAPAPRPRSRSRPLRRRSARPSPSSRSPRRPAASGARPTSTPAYSSSSCLMPAKTIATSAVREPAAASARCAARPAAVNPSRWTATPTPAEVIAPSYRGRRKTQRRFCGSDVTVAELSLFDPVY